MRIAFVLGCILLSGCSSMLYYPTKKVYIKSDQIPKPHEYLNFESESGNKLSAMLLCAKTCADSEKPLIVQFHGNGQNMTAHLLSLYWLTDHGYDFLTFDYAGYGGSEGSPSPRETLLDGEAALKWATSRFPNRKIILYGQSLGGAIALKLAIDNQRKHQFPIVMTVAESTFDSYEDIAADVLSRTWVTWLFQPLAYLVMSDRYAPGKDVAQISPIPLIVIHSDKDSIVPKRFGQRIFDNAKEPKFMWTYPQPGHVISSLVENGRINDLLLEQFGRL